MADDMLIGVGVKADFSSLKGEAKSAADALKQAQANWEEAFAQLGKAAEQGSEQAISTLKQYEAELQQAQTRAAAAAQSMSQVGAATSHAVPQFAAASAAIRTLEGNFQNNVRAAERFLSTTLGLGPALQAAFPVVGAIAMIGVVSRLGEELYHAFDIGGEGARKLAQDMHEANQSAELWNASLRVQNDRLSDQIAKIEHKPTNALKTALDEAAEAALQLQEHLDKDIESYMKLIQQQAGSWEQRTLGLTGGTGYEYSMLEQHRVHLQGQPTEEGKLAESQRYSISIQTRLNELLAAWGTASEQAKARDWAKEHNVQLRQVAEMSQAAASTEISATRDLIHWQEMEASGIKQLIDQRNQQAHLGKDRDGKNGDDNGRKADQERMRADETAFNQLRMSHQLTLREEEQFWTERLTRYRKGTSEYEQITAKLAEIIQRERTAEDKALTQGSRDYVSALIAAKKQEQQENEKIDEAVEKSWEDDLKRQERAAEAAQESAALQIEAATRVAEARVQYQLASGAISQEAAAHALAAIHAKDYADRIKELEKELEALRQIEAMGGNTAERQGEVQNKITGLQGQASATSMNDQASLAKNFEKPWVTAFQSINRQWTGTMDSILRGQMRIGQGALRMANEMLIDVINSLTQMGLKWAEHYILVNLLQTQSKAQQASVDTAANAARAVTNVAAVTGDAAVAAAGALAYYSASAPEIAPAMAAAQYAMTMTYAPLASAAGGWGEVPNDQLAMIHKKEMVMPANLAEGARRVFAGASSAMFGGDTTHINARITQNFPNAAAASSASSSARTLRNLQRKYGR